MTRTRNNHYVPQWYQNGFMCDGKNELSHLKRKIIDIPSGPKIVYSKKQYTTAQCFYQTDLYTTYFGSEYSDEIERYLFGLIDEKGSQAVKAFLTDDQSQWHEHFQNIFIYLDAQKLRTPKGLDWIRTVYPKLNQNELMVEMQALRSIHCTLWAEGVRELVSAEDSDVKFIFSDHPVTIYNYACPPNSELCDYPKEPDIALKGSQTIFPLDKNRCLILTNLEYAKNPDNVNPLEFRTNAKKIRQSMVNTIEFINTRRLTSEEVRQINHIIKSRAKESIGAGDEEWLFPENGIDYDWAELGKTLLPSSHELYRFGGELYAKFNDGSVHYQDAFGRTENYNSYLHKDVDEKSIGRNEPCGCGSNKKYKDCCRNIPKHLRTTWSVLSIRERNLAFCRAITDILGLDSGTTWADVRRDITNEKISNIYSFYATLWPRNTDIYSMLPKSDSKFRGLYSGPIDVRVIRDCAISVSSYFDEFIIASPIVNPNMVKPKFSPIESPEQFKYQALKDFAFMLELEPLIGLGLINLIPDPTDFDLNLLREMMGLATERDYKPDMKNRRDYETFLKLSIDDLLNTTHSLPHDVKVQMLMSEFGTPRDQSELVISELEADADERELALLQRDVGKQILQFKMSPNYEMTLFIAQATGSVIVTDSEHRWNELRRAQHRSQGIVHYPWNDISNTLTLIPLDYEIFTKFEKSLDKEFVYTRNLLKSIDDFVRSENIISAEIIHLKNRASEVAKLLISSDIENSEFLVLSPEGGFYDKTVQRLLIISSCPNYDNYVRSVIYIGRKL